MNKALFLMLIGLHLVAHSEETLTARLEAHQVAIDDRGIFAQIDGCWIPVESISIDTHGLYATYHNPYHGRWRCPRCGFSNDPWQDRCQNLLANGLCLTPRPDPK